MVRAVDRGRSGELRKTLESGDPSQMRQGSLEVLLEGESEQSAAEVLGVTVSMALALDRGRSGEMSKAKVSKPLQRWRG